MGKPKLTREIFEEKSNLLHNNKYTYDNVIYINNKTYLYLSLNMMKI